MRYLALLLLLSGCCTTHTHYLAQNEQGQWDEYIQDTDGTVYHRLYEVIDSTGMGELR